MSFGGLNRKGNNKFMQGATGRYDELLAETEKNTEIISALDRLIGETKDLVKQISINEKGIVKKKCRVLYNIYCIYTNHVSELERKYQTDIKRFIEDTFENQANKTNLNDAKTIELLVHHSMGSLLEQDIAGMLTSLKSLAYMAKKRDGNEELIFQQQKLLLERLGDERLSPNQVSIEINNFKKQSSPTLKVINEVPKEWKVVAPRTGSKIELNGFQKQEHQQDLLKLLETINSDNLEQFLKFSETLKE